MVPGNLRGGVWGEADLTGPSIILILLNFTSFFSLKSQITQLVEYFLIGSVFIYLLYNLMLDRYLGFVSVLSLTLYCSSYFLLFRIAYLLLPYKQLLLIFTLLSCFSFTKIVREVTDTGVSRALLGYPLFLFYFSLGFIFFI